MKTNIAPRDWEQGQSLIALENLRSTGYGILADHSKSIITRGKEYIVRTVQMVDGCLMVTVEADDRYQCVVPVAAFRAASAEDLSKEYRVIVHRSINADTVTSYRDQLAALEDMAKHLAAGHNATLTTEEPL